MKVMLIGRSANLLWAGTLACVAALALCVVAATSYVQARKWLDHSLQVSESATEWLLALVDAETGARGYVIAGAEEFLDPYGVALKRARDEAERLRALVQDEPEQLAAVLEVERLSQRVLDHLQQNVGLVSAGSRQQANAWVAEGEGKERMDAFRQRMGVVRQQTEVLLRERRAAAQNRALGASLGILVLGLTAVGMLSYAWVLQRTRAEAMSRLAADADARLLAVSDVATALAEARLRTEVASVIVDQGVRIAGADTCTLYLLNETRTTLELLAQRGVSEEILALIERLPAEPVDASAPNPLTSALWVESEREYARLFPGLISVKAEGQRAKAFWSLPLIAEGRPVGVVAMGFYTPRSFSREDRVLVETLAQQCAQALYRSLRLAREEEARTWFTTTLRSIGDAVIATDATGRITFMNPIAEALTDWTEAEATGKPLDDVFRIFAEESGHVVESPVTKVLREGTIVGLANHTVLHSKHGIVRPIDDSGAPIRNERGELTGVVLVFRDATNEQKERLQREFIAHASEELISSLDYEATLANVARLAVPALADWCAVELLEPGGRTSRQAAVAHVDASKVEFARRLGERYPPDPRATTGAPEVMRTGKSELYVEIPQQLLEAAAQDAEHLRLIRSLQLESGMVVPLLGRGRILGVVTFAYAESGRRYNQHDLTFAEDFARRAALAIENAMALKETERARAQEQSLRNDAELAGRAKDEFLAIVSHELRTPLNAILGWTVMLRSGNHDGDLERGLSVIERNARTQTKLIDDVLDVSRIISGKLTLNMSHTNLTDVISASIDTIAPAAEAKAIQIRRELTTEPLLVTVDPGRVQQVVWNLLANAIKFTPKGGSVAVRIAREGSDVAISVEDNGEGIRAETLPLVFSPFQQADASTTRKHGGLGLGLAIVKQLVAGHGGTVHALSEGEGKGATFIVRFPARSAVPALADRTSSNPVNEAEAHSFDSSALVGRKILVVDDEQDAVTLMSELLTAYGAEVETASSAQEALEKFELLRPDLIVSDIGMPFEDGYSLIRRIRARPVTLGGNTPAVALTAYVAAKDQRQALEAGFQAHVSKPVDPSHLARQLTQLARTLRAKS